MDMPSDSIDRLKAALADHYRIERELGRGGMAVVYLAEDLRHGRPVAIKVMRPELAEAMEQERFAREIEVAARLSHPNILGIHDSGGADGTPWFVMPYVDGESLRDVLDREGTLGLDRATSYTRAIASALAYAHAQGLVHRDIKPENVLLQAGHAVLCDFGIAKVLTEAQRDSLTRTGTSIGTFSYMSPEQLTDGADVDGRSDIYALGCVLHEMLIGQAPFGASTPHASMAQKLMGELPERSPNPDVPDTVWRVVRKALAPEAGDRFADGEEFREALSYATTEVAFARSRRQNRTMAAVRTVGGGATIVAAGMLAFWLVGQVGGPTYDRLAVLPLVNGAGDPGEDFYVQGVYEDLVEDMQRAGLRVLNSSSARRLAETGASGTEIAETFEADALIEGSIERVGPRVLIDVRLVDGQTEDVVWSDNFSGSQVDLRAILHQITLGISERTGASLTADALAQLEESAVVDPILYELLLQARYDALLLSDESLNSAERYYTRAVARDSMSAEAWAGLAALPGFRSQQGLISGEEARVIRDSILALAPVLEVDPAATAIATVWQGWQAARWDEAERLFLQALEEHPSDAATRGYYAQFLSYVGRVEESLREGERASRQAPDDALVQGLWAQILTWVDRLDEAEAALVRARRFNPDAPYLLSMLRTTYHLQDRDSLAIGSWRDSYRVAGDLEAIDALEVGLEEDGYEGALRSVAELFEQRRNDGGRVSEWQVGTLYTRAGEEDKAIEYLTLALDEGDPNSLSIAVDAIFHPMRADSRFQELVDRLQLPR
jgi:serine/threonine-protein kinase